MLAIQKKAATRILARTVGHEIAKEEIDQVSGAERQCTGYEYYVTRSGNSFSQDVRTAQVGCS